MDDYVRFLLDESARQGRSASEQPATVSRRQLSPRELVDSLNLTASPSQREFLEALIAAVPPTAAALDGARPGLPIPPA